MIKQSLQESKARLLQVGLKGKAIHLNRPRVDSLAGWQAEESPLPSTVDTA